MTAAHPRRLYAVRSTPPSTARASRAPRSRPVAADVRGSLDGVTSGQETLIIFLLIVVLVLLGGTGFFALLRERYRRGRGGQDQESDRGHQRP